MSSLEVSIWNKASIFVTGLQWGDEGKGKVVDWLAEVAGAQTFVRFQGGNNAGHTIMRDGQVYAISSLPSGIISGKTCLIGSGVAVNPEKLTNEIRFISTATSVNITPDILKISRRCPIVLPLYQDLEKFQNNQKYIGTTMQGIGPAYEDQVGRRGLRLGDLFGSSNSLTDKVERLLLYHNSVRRGFDQMPVSSQSILDWLYQFKHVLEPFVGSVDHILRKLISQDRTVFEGAQGVCLDIYHGTYPHVTGVSTLPGQLCVSSGVPMSGSTHKVLGILKAYSTRVGMGSFPTECTGSEGQVLQNMGMERGTITGRTRRCGWLDGVLCRWAIQSAAIDECALTKLDVLGGMKKFYVCTGYIHESDIMTDLQDISIVDLEHVKPVYKEFSCWPQGSINGITEFEELPQEAKDFVLWLEDYLGVKIRLISTGADTRHMILCS